MIALARITSSKSTKHVTVTGPKKTAPNLAGDMTLRALAISCVVMIHVLSSIKDSPFWNGSPYQPLVVGIDQFSRLCVPVFVALSGYGLFQKYKDQSLDLWSFLTRRVFKLLPWYVIWSAIFVVVFWFRPAWSAFQGHPNFLELLIFGRADYQLYFVPMIFQLYLLFPVLRWLYQRFPLLLLLVVGIGELGWYWFLMYQFQHPLPIMMFRTDQQQYLSSLTWIWYFVLGMSLPSIHAFIKKVPLKNIVGAVAFIGTWWWTSSQALQQIQSWHDPLFALRFTRFPILLFATMAVIWLTYWSQQMRWTPKIVALVGRYSYGIYLSHTLLLRIIFTLL